MRVALLIPYAFGGGAETVVRLLADRLRATGHDACIIHTLGATPPEAVRLPRIAGPLAVPAAVRRAVRRFGADVVHCHVPWIGMQAVIELAAGRTPPIVYTLHSPIDRKSRHLQLIERFVVGRVDRVLAVSPSVAASCSVRSPAVVPNAVELRGVAPVESNTSLLWIGRIIRSKRPLDFVAALARNPSILGRIVGAGPEYGSVADTGRGLTNLELAGWSDDPVAEISAAAAVVFTSDFEGLPIVALEAMSCGVPFVAPRRPEFEWLVPGDYPYLFEPGSAPGLDAALVRVTDDASGRAAWGRRLRGIAAARFAPEELVRAHVAVYDDVAVRREVRRR